MPTSTNRSVAGEETLNAAAMAIANTVPGTAQGTDSSASTAPAPRSRRRSTMPAASVSATAATVAAVAIQRLFTSGRARTGSSISAT